MDTELFCILSSFLSALSGGSEDEQDAIESLAVVRLLRALGLDAGETYGAVDDYSEEAIAGAREARTSLIARINRGITASGL